MYKLTSFHSASLHFTSHYMYKPTLLLSTHLSHQRVKASREPNAYPPFRLVLGKPSVVRLNGFNSAFIPALEGWQLGTEARHRSDSNIQCKQSW